MLLEYDAEVPSDSLFRNDIFVNTCEKLEKRNEARVIQGLTGLIITSAETLATYGAKHPRNLVESVNEGWNNSIPVTKKRPQPDYAVGFRMDAFSQSQLDRLQPFIGELNDSSFFAATYYMYFPFFTCEVKCSAAALDIADRQNAHSMTVAVRAVVELFRLVGQQQELHGEILGFSVSPYHRTVRIFGHYAAIKGTEQNYHRHFIHAFDILALDGKKKWTAYKLVKNVYDKWMPSHLERIPKAIDLILSNLNFSVSESGLSQGSSSASEGCGRRERQCRASRSPGIAKYPEHIHGIGSNAAE